MVQEEIMILVVGSTGVLGTEIVRDFAANR